MLAGCLSGLFRETESSAWIGMHQIDQEWLRVDIYEYQKRMRANVYIDRLFSSVPRPFVSKYLAGPEIFITPPCAGNNSRKLTGCSMKSKSERI